MRFVRVPIQWEDAYGWDNPRPTWVNPHQVETVQHRPVTGLGADGPPTMFRVGGQTFFTSFTVDQFVALLEEAARG